jgi:hypothetical protein
MNGGFDGYISDLWYHNYALGTAEIQKTVIAQGLIKNWAPTLPAEFYGPDPSQDSTEFAVQ